MRSLTITRPDDWHVHFRDDQVLQHTVNATAQHFSRALVMPNLKPPLTTIEAISAYRERILHSLDQTHSFTPYMTFYLNDAVDGDALRQAQKEPFILGAKLYPAGATTNSEAGVQSIAALYPLLDIMQEEDLVLQIHGEVTSGDVFARERRFLEEHLTPLVKNFPKLRVVLEHISTKAAVEFVMNAPEEVAATITPHHMLFNRNHLLAGGIRPHYYCLPILKSQTDQKAVLKAAVSGNSKFFAGTDSAPHTQEDKESACGCAGIYSAPFALSLYAQAFAERDKLERLDAFMGRFGAEFYRLPVSDECIELFKKPQTIPQQYAFGADWVIPILAGQSLQWSIHASS